MVGNLVIQHLPLRLRMNPDRSEAEGFLSGPNRRQNSGEQGGRASVLLAFQASHGFKEQPFPPLREGDPLFRAALRQLIQDIEGRQLLV